MMDDEDLATLVHLCSRQSAQFLGKYLE